MLKKFIQLLNDAYWCWSADKASTFAAALAYYAIFALAPILVICISVASFVMGNTTIDSEIIKNTGELVGTESAQQLDTLIHNLNKPSTNFWASILGFGILIVASAGFFYQLQDSLNYIWGVKAKSHRSWIHIIHDRFLSVLVVFLLAFLLLCYFIISTFISAYQSYLGTYFLTQYLWVVFNLLFSFFFLTLFFLIIYKVLPDVVLKWSDVIIGSLFSAILFTLGKFVFEIYFMFVNVSSTFGALGAFIVILIWIYYFTQILFFGAEITKISAKHHHRIRVSENAKKLPS